MQTFITIIVKAIRYLYAHGRTKVNKFFTCWNFFSNNVHYKKFKTHGIPYVMIARGGTCAIGNNFRMNNGLLGNPIGRPQKCVFFVDHGATLNIGNHVGMSSTAIVVHKKITIGNYVTIGGGVCIYDTNFHSLDPTHRVNPALDRQFEKKLSVFIEDNVFIGAHTTILKGVTIGKNSIIGACSVVTRNIPANEIWAGNPAKFLKKLSDVK